MVRITNAAVQIDPAGAALSYTNLLAGKFPYVDIKAVMKDLTEDPDAVWPTSGEVIGKCRAKAAIRAPSRNSGDDYANIHGMRFDQLMQSRQGYWAMRKGKPYTFLQDVISGKMPFDELDLSL